MLKKWNKGNHRLFSFSSIDWRWRQLHTYETVINLTKSRGGLAVCALLDRRRYPIGKQVLSKELRKLNIERADFHGVGLSHQAETKPLIG